MKTARKATMHRHCREQLGQTRHALSQNITALARPDSAEGESDSTFTSPHVRTALPTTQECRGTAVHTYMRFFALLLSVSVGLGCATTRTSRDVNSPEDGNEEETEPQSGESEESAEAEEGDGDDKAQEESRPAKKRRPKRKRHVQAAPEPEPAPIARAAKPPPPPPVEPPPEEAAPAYSDGADQGEASLEAEARKRCHWKKVPPYRPEWANSISPPLSRKITSKPICSYGTPPAVLRVARQIAVQQAKPSKR
jgi:hypothetical protein